MTKDANRSAGSSAVSESIADQVLNATDTLVAGSILSFAAREARTQFRFRGWMSKTAAGVAAPTFRLRVGTLGTIADAAKVVFVAPAQTAAVDTGFFEILAILRSTGASTSAVLAGLLRMQHHLDATGLSVVGTPTIEAVSPGFDSTTRDALISLSIDPGAAGVWTLKGFTAEIINT